MPMTSDRGQGCYGECAELKLTLSRYAAAGVEEAARAARFTAEHLVGIAREVPAKIAGEAQIPGRLP